MTPAPPAPSGWPDWSPAMALVGFVTAFLVAGLFGSVALVAGGDVGDPPAAASLAAILIQDAALLAVAIGFAGMVGRRPTPAEFGLRRVRVKTAVLWTLAAYGTYTVLSGLFLVAVNAETRDDIPDQLGADESTLATIGVAVAVTVLAPLVEELFFRGYLYGALRKWGVAVGAVISGLLFGAVHAGGSDPAFLLPLAFFGIVLALLYEKTRSLYPCIVLHAVNNCVALSVSLDWSWQVPIVFAGSLGTITLVLLAVRRLGQPGVVGAPAVT